MRLTRQIATATLLFGSCCFGQTSPNATAQKPTTSSPVFSLAVDPPASPIRLGSPIIVTVTMDNISAHEIYLASDTGSDSKYTGFTYLLMKDGREVETTQFHRRLTGRQRSDDPVKPFEGGSSSILLSHPPGKVYVIPIDLKQLYQITDPGVYTFDVSRFDDYSKTMVRSKTVTLNMVP